MNINKTAAQNTFPKWFLMFSSGHDGSLLPGSDQTRFPNADANLDLTLEGYIWIMPELTCVDPLHAADSRSPGKNDIVYRKIGDLQTRHQR